MDTLPRVLRLKLACTINKRLFAKVRLSYPSENDLVMRVGCAWERVVGGAAAKRSDKGCCWNHIGDKNKALKRIDGKTSTDLVEINE
jgi:hypothetical protein